MDAVERLRSIGAEIYHLERVVALLGWDQETYMPSLAIEGRAEQLAAMQTLIHRKSTSSEIGECLDELGANDELPSGVFDVSTADGGFVRAWYRRYTRDTKLPVELVTRIARETSKAQAVWVRAREADDFSSFSPSLETVLGLARETADCIGYKEHPYDALLDEYEPWLTTAEVSRVFRALSEQLIPIIRAIGEAPQVDDSFLRAAYPRSDQEAFCREVLAEIGFPSDSGRLDVSAHPFTTSLGGKDVRLTTRYLENHMQTSLFGTIHEAGHGLYELGFADETAASILANGASMGIHESQSRTWENVIGRSRPFWNRFFPRLKSRFPSQLEGVDVDAFYGAVNRVEPSLIRVEADEVTYNMHIILRFNLERELVSGNLPVAELPTAWREESHRLLGIESPNDRDGVLQDIHWSMGGFGYFPTYALGNLYGAQFFGTLRGEMADLDERIERGDFESILSWQRERIHRWGAAKTAAEICTEVTGESLDPDHFIRYVRSKYHELYDV